MRYTLTLKRKHPNKLGVDKEQKRPGRMQDAKCSSVGQSISLVFLFVPPHLSLCCILFQHPVSWYVTLSKCVESLIAQPQCAQRHGKGVESKYMNLEDQLPGDRLSGRSWPARNLRVKGDTVLRI